MSHTLKTITLYAVYVILSYFSIIAIDKTVYKLREVLGIDTVIDV